MMALMEEPLLNSWMRSLDVPVPPLRLVVLVVVVLAAQMTRPAAFTPQTAVASGAKPVLASAVPASR